MCTRINANVMIRKPLAVLLFFIMILRILAIGVIFIVALPWIIMSHQISIEMQTAKDQIIEEWQIGLETIKSLWRNVQ